MARDETTKSIKLSTYGIFFFGTPHRGVSGVSFLKLRLGLASIFRLTSTRLLSLLESGSEWLQDQQDQYRSIAAEFSTVHVYESHPMKVAPGIHSVLVPFDSAVVPDNVNSQIVGLEADHSSMVKFTGPLEINFIRTCDKLLPMLTAADTTVSQRWASYDRSNVEGVPPVDSFDLTLRLPFPRNPNFMGRAWELAALEERILPKKVSLFSVGVLYGMGGIGKTQLALEFIYRNYKHYTAILWVDARTKNSAAKDFVAIARRLRPGWNICDNPHILMDGFEPQVLEAQEIVKDWLALTGNNKWLLVFDNLDDLETFDLRKEFFPFVSAGQILITSRRPDTRRYGTISVNVDEIDPKSAYSLLQASSGNYPTTDAEVQALNELATKLQFLPLALDQAGAYMNIQDITYREYINQYRRNFSQIAAKIPPATAWDYSHTLFTTWQVSLDALLKKDLEGNTCAVVLFMVLGFISPDDIDQTFFKYFDLVLDSLFKLECSIPESFELLMSYSLIRRKARSKEFFIHPVIQTWAREMLSAEEKIQLTQATLLLINLNTNIDGWREWYHNAPRPLEKQAAYLMEAMSKYNINLENLELRQISMVHVKVLTDNILSLFDTEDISFILGFSDLENVLTEYGLWVQAASLYQLKFEENNPGFPIEVAELMYNSERLAFLYLGLNEISRAEQLQIELLQWLRESYGEDDIRTLNGDLLLAEIYLAQGRLIDANNLSLMIAERTEDEVYELHPGPLGLDTSYLGNPSHLRTRLKLGARLNIAWIGFQSNLTIESVSRQMHLVEEAKRYLGPFSSETTDAINMLALIHLTTNQPREAQMLLEPLIDDLSTLLGPYHPNILVYKNNLANAYAAQNLFPKALEMFSQVSAGWKETMPEHPAAALSLNDMNTVQLRIRSLTISEGDQIHPQTIHSPGNSTALLRRGWSSSGSRLRQSWLLGFYRLLFKSLKIFFLEATTVALHWFPPVASILTLSGLEFHEQPDVSAYQSTSAIAEHKNVQFWNLDDQNIPAWDVSGRGVGNNVSWGFDDNWGYLLIFPLYSCLVFILADIHF